MIGKLYYYLLHHTKASGQSFRFVERLVYSALVHRVKFGDGFDVAEQTGLDPRTVATAVASLQTAGLVADGAALEPTCDRKGWFGWQPVKGKDWAWQLASHKCYSPGPSMSAGQAALWSILTNLAKCQKTWPIARGLSRKGLAVMLGNDRTTVGGDLLALAENGLAVLYPAKNRKELLAVIVHEKPDLFRDGLAEPDYGLPLDIIPPVEPSPADDDGSSEFNSDIVAVAKQLEAGGMSVELRRNYVKMFGTVLALRCS